MKEPRESNITGWSPQHNTLIDGTQVGVIHPAWTSDRRGNFIIWTDAQRLAETQTQADAWNQQRSHIAILEAESRRLISGISTAWTERARAEANARFIEDYGDATLWPEHEQTLTLTHPWSHQTKRTSKDHRDTDPGLTYLVHRLIETGRPPHGLTVREALTLLDEALHEPGGHAYRGGTGGRTITLPDDVLDLRFPTTRTGIDS